MPDNPNNWLQLILQMPGEAQALIAAMITASLRIMYDRSDTSWQRQLLESLLCGCIGVGLYSGAGYLGLPPSMGVFIGSSVGFLGVLKFREIVFKFLGKKFS